jgi:hypothetical protein
MWVPYCLYDLTSIPLGIFLEDILLCDGTVTECLGMLHFPLGVCRVPVSATSPEEDDMKTANPNWSPRVHWVPCNAGLTGGEYWTCDQGGCPDCLDQARWNCYAEAPWLAEVWPD